MSRKYWTIVDVNAGSDYLPEMRKQLLIWEIRTGDPNNVFDHKEYNHIIDVFEGATENALFDEIFHAECAGAEYSDKGPL